MVLTNFAKMYPENVKGMVLVKPFDEEILKTSKFKKSIRFKYYKSKLEYLGSSVFVTSILDKLGLSTTVDGFEESLPRGANDEFAVHKTKKEYRQAVAREVGNLYKYEEVSQINDLIGNNPLYIISNNENDPLMKLGPKEYSNLYVTDSEAKLIPIADEDMIVNGISHVLKEVKKIERKSNKNK